MIRQFSIGDYSATDGRCTEKTLPTLVHVYHSDVNLYHSYSYDYTSMFTTTRECMDISSIHKPDILCRRTIIEHADRTYFRDTKKVCAGVGVISQCSSLSLF